MSRAARAVAATRQGRRRSRDTGPAAPKLMPRGLYRYVWRVSGRAQIGLALLSVVVFLLDLAPLELQRRIVNDALRHRQLNPILWLCALYAVLALAQGASKLVLNIWRSKVSESANRRLRLDTYAIAVRHPAKGVEAEREGLGLSIILSEVEPVGGFIGGCVSDPVLHAGILLSVFGYMVYLQPWMALVAIALFGPQFVFVPLLQQAINRRTERRIQILRNLSIEIVNENTDRLPGEPESLFKRRVNNIYRLNMEIFRRKFSMNFLMNLLHHLGIAGILLVGGWFVVRRRIEVGTVVAFISGLSRINDPWGDLVNFFRDLTNARMKYQLIAGVLDEAAVADAPDPIAVNKK